jgi:hypothetical protein
MAQLGGCENRSRYHGRREDDLWSRGDTSGHGSEKAGKQLPHSNEPRQPTWAGLALHILLSKTPARSKQERFHSRLAHVQPVRDLGVAQTFDLAEQQDPLVALRQLAQSLSNRLILLPRLHAILRTFHVQ